LERTGEADELRAPKTVNHLMILKNKNGVSQLDTGR